MARSRSESMADGTGWSELDGVCEIGVGKVAPQSGGWISYGNLSCDSSRCLGS